MNMKSSNETASDTVLNESVASVRKRAIAAALDASEKVMVESTSLISYNCKNNVLVIGNDQRVNHAVNKLSATMNLTLLIDNNEKKFDASSLPENITTSYGQLSDLSGHLGQFVAEIIVKKETVNLAKLHNSMRDSFDLVIDLSNEPVFVSSLLPFGYFAPENDLELEEAIVTIPDMIGEFEKPKFFEYNASVCAHGNSGISACQRCIDVCPADAITSIKDAIAVDPFLCQGGGACATVCPSGAIQYVYPRLQDTLEKLRCILKAYYAAGGQQAKIVFYGEEEISLLDNDEQGYYSDYIPFQLEETASAGMEVWLCAFAYGAHEVMLLIDDNSNSVVNQALDTQLSYAHTILEGMGYAASCLYRQSANPATSKIHDSFNVVIPGTFMALNDKRSALRMAVDHLYLHAPIPQDIVSLPAGAPFGEVQVNKDKCTLCMACVSVCPAKALADGKELPQLRFSEANCVQCGLCSKACPEVALTLSARYNYAADIKRVQRILHEDEPFLCISCSKPFATHSVINKITEKLKGHHMFQTGEAINRLKMCEDCRVSDMFSNEMGIAN